MLHRHQHVLLKFRVVPVPFGIAQHQRELGDDVLEIMHHKRRHPVECIEFPGFEEGFRGLHPRQETCRLAASGAKHVVYLPIDIDGCAGAGQDHEAGHFLIDNQRNHQPGVGYAIDPLGDLQFGIAARRRPELLEIDDPAPTDKKSAER